MSAQDSALGRLQFSGSFILCPNPQCKQVTIRVGLYNITPSGGTYVRRGEPVGLWQLRPASNAKVLPDYVAQAIREDYTEACLIKDLSPKASATLARRALQGMIRDFWGIVKPKLVQEIDEIKDKVDADTWKAIDGLRHIGNIGAHMEKDIGTIVDVEPEEAEQLIWLIETLVEDWYVTRVERKKRLEELAALAAEKKEARAKKNS